MTLLNFGKHKGKNLTDVARDFPDYLQWLMQQQFFRDYKIYDEVRAIVGTLPSNTALPRSSSAVPAATAITVVGSCQTVPWGKYKDKPLSDLLADLDYCQFLIKQPWLVEKKDIYPRVRDAVAASSGSVTAPYSVIDDTSEPVKIGALKGRPLAELYADTKECTRLLSCGWFHKYALYPAVKGAVERAGLPIPAVTSGSDVAPVAAPAQGAVRFGKYKGQDESVLLADTGYCSWLASQSDFAMKNPDISARVLSVAASAPKQPVATFKFAGVSTSAPPPTTVWAPSATTDSSWTADESHYVSDDD